MPPTIHFVRHGVAAHNISLDGSLSDPALTQLGEQQAASLRDTFPHHAQLTRVISSPLQRAMQTAILAFSRDDLGPVVALDTLQETSDFPSSTGPSLEGLRERYGNAVDLTLVREGWNDKGKRSIFEPEWEKLVARTRDARRTIRELAGTTGDGHVVVVAHGAVLLFLTEDWETFPEIREFFFFSFFFCAAMWCLWALMLTFSDIAYPWGNCEHRMYEFTDPTGQDGNATLRETDDSWRRRKGEQRRYTDAEQMEMRGVMRKIVDAGVMKTNKA